MRRAKSVFCFIMAIAMVVVFTIPAFAAEEPEISPRSSTDVPFRFEFIALVGTHRTDTDPDHMGVKEDTSSVYVDVWQFPGNFYLYTNAYVDGQVKDCTSRPALVTRSGEWLVYNVIYETYGRVNACLGGVRAQGGNVTGEWSPDYTYYPGDNIPHVNP